MAKDLYVASLLDFYGEFLSEKQRRVTDYYFNDDLSLSEIAENEGITRQGVSDLIKRTEIQLKNWEEKCGYCKKILELKNLSEEKNIQHFDKILKIIDNL